MTLKNNVEIQTFYITHYLNTEYWSLHASNRLQTQERPVDIYRNVTIKITLIHTHKHTHTHRHMYILLGLRKKKNYVTLLYILVTSSLLPSLSYNQIIFCLHPDHQIPQYGHLLKSLTLKGWYSASQDGGMNFQTKHYKYFLYSITFHWGIFFHLTSKTRKTQ